MSLSVRLPLVWRRRIGKNLEVFIAFLSLLSQHCDNQGQLVVCHEFKIGLGMNIEVLFFLAPLNRIFAAAHAKLCPNTIHEKNTGPLDRQMLRTPF